MSYVGIRAMSDDVFRLSLSKDDREPPRSRSDRCSREQRQGCQETDSGDESERAAEYM